MYLLRNYDDNGTGGHTGRGPCARCHPDCSGGWYGAGLHSAGEFLMGATDAEAAQYFQKNKVPWWV